MVHSVQIFVSYFNAQQITLVMNGALKSQVDRMAHPVELSLKKTSYPLGGKVIVQL